MHRMRLRSTLSGDPVAGRGSCLPQGVGPPARIFSELSCEWEGVGSCSSTRRGPYGPRGDRGWNEAPGQETARRSGSSRPSESNRRPSHHKSVALSTNHDEPALRSDGVQWPGCLRLSEPLGSAEPHSVVTARWWLRRATRGHLGRLVR